MTLDGKVAVVTGAAQGIGQEIAARLAHNGANVVVADLDADRCLETIDLVQKAGREARPYKVNVANWDEVKAMTESVLKEWSHVDILVNNAGITRDGLLMRMKEEDWDLVLQGESHGDFSLYQGPGTLHEQAALWPDHQYCLDRWRDWQYWTSELRGIKSCRDWVDQDRRAGICESHGDGKCGCAGFH